MQYVTNYKHFAFIILLHTNTIKMLVIPFYAIYSYTTNKIF